MHGYLIVGGGYPLNSSRPQGFPYGSVPSKSNLWKPSTSQNPVYYFPNVRNYALSGWNSPAPPCLPFLETLNFPDLLKFTNDLI